MTYLCKFCKINDYPTMDPASVTCPTCFETFEVPSPPLSEVPCTVDYDCEVCCRPMSIEFYEEDGEVIGQALGLAD